MKTIKIKFIVILGTLLSVVCIGLGLVAYFNAANAIYKTAEKLVTGTAKESARVVEARINTRFREMLTIANTEEMLSTTLSPEEKMVYLEQEAKRGGYLSFGIGDAEGETLTMAGVTINLKERPYYQEALKGKSVVTDPIISKEDNTTLIVNYAVPIQDKSGKVTGVLIGARYGDELSTITNDIVLGDTGQAYMINKEGTVVAHYNEEAVRTAENIIEKAKEDISLKSLADIMLKMTEGTIGFDEYIYNSEIRFVAYAPVENTNWILATVVPKRELLSALDSLKVSMVIVSIMFLFIGLVVSYFISNFFSKQIKGIESELNIISKGDFTSNQSFVPKRGKDEIAHMYESMANMKEVVGGMIKAIKDTAGAINKNSKDLSLVSEQMSTASGGVATAIQETAEGVSSQARGLSEINEVLYSFGEKLENIVMNIVDIDTKSKDIDSMSNKGNQDMQLLMESIGVMEKAFKDFTFKMGGLNENINKVTEITNLINSIAAQTNLLALNAAIEAARAGESGRGFSVVAEEIRKLAEQSQLSSQNINVLINNITGDASSIIQTTNELNKELNTQVNVVEGTIGSYKNIVQSIKAISTKIESANMAAVEINNEKSIILSRVEDASAVAEEVAASSEEISATTQEMSSSSQEVAGSAKNMDVLISGMLEQVNQFKV